MCELRRDVTLDQVLITIDTFTCGLEKTYNVCKSKFMIQKRYSFMLRSKDPNEFGFNHFMD